MKKIVYLLLLAGSCLRAMTANETNFFTNRGTVAHGNHANAVSWLGRDGNMYVGMGGGTAPLPAEFELRVLKFDFFDNGELKILPGDANQDHGIDESAAVFSVDWLTHNNISYLAMGGEQSAEELDINTTRVYLFDHPDEVLTLKSSADHGATVNSVELFPFNDIMYLAAAGDIGTDNFTTRIYRVDPSNEAMSAGLVNSQTHGATVNSVNWLSCGENIFLATGGNRVGEVTTRIYQFNTTTQVLTEFPLARTDHGVDVTQVAWLVHNGVIYLTSAGGDMVRMYRFNQVNEALTEVAMLTITDPDFGIDINTIAWVNIGGIKYLAIGAELTNGDNVGRLYVYRFNGTGATPFTEISSARRDHEASVNKVAWLQYGAQTFLALAGDVDEGEGISIRTYQVNFVEDALNVLLRRKYFQEFAKDTSPRATAHC